MKVYFEQFNPLAEAPARAIINESIYGGFTPAYGGMGQKKKRNMSDMMGGIDPQMLMQMMGGMGGGMPPMGGPQMPGGMPGGMPGMGGPQMPQEPEPFDPSAPAPALPELPELGQQDPMQQQQMMGGPQMPGMGGGMDPQMMMQMMGGGMPDMGGGMPDMGGGMPDMGGEEDQIMQMLMQVMGGMGGGMPPMGGGMPPMGGGMPPMGGGMPPMGGGMPPMGGGMPPMGGGMPGMPQQQQEPQKRPMWDANSGKKMEMTVGDPANGIEGVRGIRDINADEQSGYMMAAGDWRVSQPSGGADPSQYQMSYGVDPSQVRGLSPAELPTLFDFNALQQRQQQHTQNMIQAGFKDQAQGPEFKHMDIPNQGAPAEIIDHMGGVSDLMKSLQMQQQYGGGNANERMIRLQHELEKQKQRLQARQQGQASVVAGQQGGGMPGGMPGGMMGGY